MNNLFYIAKDSINTEGKKKDFDAYSKTPSDIIEFYRKKYSEIDVLYKLPEPYCDYILGEIDSLRGSNNSKLDGIIQAIEKPFELYILGFVFHMLGEHDVAIKSFAKSMLWLQEEENPAMASNVVMIKLQLSQLYDAVNNQELAIQTLISIIKDYNHNYDLKFMQEFNSFLASTFMRLGVCMFREYKLSNLSNYPVYKSIMLRYKYKQTYDLLVYEQYLATAYRIFAHSQQKTTDKYILLKESLKRRLFVLKNTKDEFNKVETAYLLFDIIYFLIEHKYKETLLRKYSRILYNTIISMKKDTRQKHKDSIVKYAILVSQYWLLRYDLYNAFKWHYLATYHSDSDDLENLNSINENMKSLNKLIS